MGDIAYQYHYDGTDLIRITDQSGETVWAFTWNDGEPLTVTNKQGDTFFYVTNQRGDVVQIVDKNGAQVATYSYDPWGNPLTSEPTDARIAEQPIRYAGYVYDSETKLYYLQARYYNPELGRFLSRDPDKGTEDLTETQHGYSYALNNPNTFTDADGRNPLIVVLVVRSGVTVAKYYIKKNGKKKLFKTVKKTVLKKKKGRGKASKYEDVTKSGSRYANRAIDVTKANFEKNLLKEGWKKTVSKDGKTTILTKNGAKYVLRDGAKSTGGPTADFYPSGSKGFTLKIRLK